jgi:hypothetical protein
MHSTWSAALTGIERNPRRTGSYELMAAQARGRR